jgi:hypothetical protein
VLQAFGWHDDAVRTVGWSIVDSIGPVTWAGPAHAATLNSLFTVDNGFYGQPLRLHHELYLTFTVIGMAAAKNAFISAVVERIVGVGTVQGA